MAEIPVREKFSRVLRAARAKAGLTQEQVAERAGISHRYYQILEAKKPTRTATLEIVEKVGKVFGRKFINF